MGADSIGFVGGILERERGNVAAETERTASFNKCKTTKIIQSMSQIITCVHAQSCPIHRIPMDCSPPGSSVHRIFQARTLEWVPISSSRGSFQPRDQTRFLCLLYWQADSLPLSQIIIKLNKNKEHEIITQALGNYSDLNKSHHEATLF